MLVDVPDVDLNISSVCTAQTLYERRFTRCSTMNTTNQRTSFVKAKYWGLILQRFVKLMCPKKMGKQLWERERMIRERIKPISLMDQWRYIGILLFLRVLY